MPPENPLSEPDPKSLDDLYSADPLTLTDPDVDRIVKDLWEKRALWEKEEKESQAQGRRRRPSAYKEKPKKGQLSLEGLDLKLPE